MTTAIKTTNIAATMGDVGDWVVDQLKPLGADMEQSGKDYANSLKALAAGVAKGDIKGQAIAVRASQIRHALKTELATRQMNAAMAIEQRANDAMNLILKLLDILK